MGQHVFYFTFQKPAPYLRHYLTDMIHFHFLHRGLQSSNADDLGTIYQQTQESAYY